MSFYVRRLNLAATMRSEKVDVGSATVARRDSEWLKFSKIFKNCSRPAAKPIHDHDEFADCLVADTIIAIYSCSE